MRPIVFAITWMFTIGGAIVGGFIMLSGLGETVEFSAVLQGSLSVFSTWLAELWRSLIPNLPLELVRPFSMAVMLPYLALSARWSGTTPFLLSQPNARVVRLFGIAVVNWVKPSLKKRTELQKVAMALAILVGLSVPIFILFMSTLGPENFFVPEKVDLILIGSGLAAMIFGLLLSRKLSPQGFVLGFRLWLTIGCGLLIYLGDQFYLKLADGVL